MQYYKYGDCVKKTDYLEFIFDIQVKDLKKYTELD